jgi:hypothetical protein
MSDLLSRLQSLVNEGEVRVSLHGFRELAADDILVDDALAGISAAIAIEEYPAAAKGPRVLVLQRDSTNRVVHIVWGIPRNQISPAVLVTAYRPDPKRWSADFMRRKKP